MTRILYLVLFAMVLTNFAVVADGNDPREVQVAAVDTSTPVKPATTSEKPLLTTITLTSQSSKSVTQSAAASNEPAAPEALFQAASLTDLNDSDVAELRLKMEQRRQKVRNEIEALKQGLKPTFKSVESASLETQPAKVATLTSTITDETQPSTAVQDDKPMVIYVVTGNRVNARSGPTTSSEVLARLVKGQAVRDAGETIGDWAKVVVVETELEVWMHKNFIAEES